MPEKPLLLLDRDGTLIEEGEYLTDPKRVKLLPGVAPALRQLKRAGFKMVVISNQSGVGRGLITMSQLRQVNRRFLQLLRSHHAEVDGLYFCPHAPSRHCNCRKPKLGMVKRAAKKLRRSWRGSISVGDRSSDVELGQKTRGKGILVRTGYGHGWKKKSGVARPDHIASDFARAAKWIIRQERKKL